MNLKVVDSLCTICFGVFSLFSSLIKHIFRFHQVFGKLCVSVRGLFDLLCVVSKMNVALRASHLCWLDSRFELDPVVGKEYEHIYYF